MQEILSMVLFGSLPQLFDITISCAYMAAALQPWIALIVFVLLITYIPLRFAQHPTFITASHSLIYSIEAPAEKEVTAHSPHVQHVSSVCVGSA